MTKAPTSKSRKTAAAKAAPTEYENQTQRMLHDFSHLLQVMGESIANDGRVDEREAARIRTEWEDLKRYGERFVCACEKGLFERGSQPTA